MPAPLNLTGRQFSRWTVLRPAPNQGRKRKWHCRCECGKEAAVFTNMLTSGASASCGCRVGEAAKIHRRVHGLTGSREYIAWAHIKQRCTNPKNSHYHLYGGRGIRLADEWMDDPAAFIAYVGPRPRGTSIERIEVNRGYEPGNVKWGTAEEQANNKRNSRFVEVDGERMTATQCARRFGVCHSAFHARVRKGQSAAAALSALLP